MWKSWTAKRARLRWAIDGDDGRFVAGQLRPCPRKTRSWKLLSGDGELRELAAKVACHGVLWLIDRREGVEDGNKLCADFRVVAAHPRCRLPKSEIRKRIRSYFDV